MTLAEGVERCGKTHVAVSEPLEKLIEVGDQLQPGEILGSTTTNPTVAAAQTPIGLPSATKT